MFFNTNNDRNRQHGFGRPQYNSKCGDGFWGKKEALREMFRNHFTGAPAANIEEREDAYLLCIYAAGLEKTRFKLSVHDNILTVSYEADKSITEKKYIYQENNQVSFKRSFQLNGQVLTEQISAAYVDGVLAINLPKNPEAQQEGQEISVH